MARSLDFLQDKMASLIFKTSVPMIVASVVTMIVQLANISFMGNASTEDIYLRSLYTPFAFLSIAVIEAFQISNQVHVARLRGEGNIEGIKQGLMNFSLVSIGVSLLLSLLIFLVSPFIATFFSIPEYLEPAFKQFLLAMYVTNTLVLLTTIFISGLRGYGHVLAATILNVLYALLNIFLVYMFAFVWYQGIFSIVIANLIVSALFLIISSIFLLKYRILAIKKKYFRMVKGTFIMLRNVGLPISISYMVIFISVFFFNKIVEPFGITAISGFGVAYNIQTFIIIPAVAIGSALGIIMNNNIGSGEKYFPRVFEAYKKGVLITFAFYFVLSVCLFIFKSNLVEFMFADSEAVTHAVSYLQIVGPSYLFLGAVLMTITTLEQINKGVIAVVLNVLYFLIITVVGWYLPSAYDDLQYFYWTIFFSNILGIISIIYTYITLRTQYGSVRLDIEQQGDLASRSTDTRIL